MTKKDGREATVDELVIDMTLPGFYESSLVVVGTDDGRIMVTDLEQVYIGYGETLKEALVDFQLNTVEAMMRTGVFPIPNGNWEELNWRPALQERREKRV